MRYPIFCLLISLLLLTPGKSFAGREGLTAGECFARIEAGNAKEMVRESKSIIMKDRWNADARSCLAMAYYRDGRAELAFRALKEAEDSIPQESIDAIHEKIWTHLPELLAEKEYKDFYPLSGGDCILRNVTAMAGNGLLVLGHFYNPDAKKSTRHVRAVKCLTGIQECREIDEVCPKCVIREKEAVITVRDYRIVNVERLISDSPIERNIRYIEKILELQRGK